MMMQGNTEFNFTFYISYILILQNIQLYFLVNNRLHTHISVICRKVESTGSHSPSHRRNTSIVQAEVPPGQLL